MRDYLFEDSEPLPPPDPVVDAATGHAPEGLASFDLAQSLRMLRSGDASQMRREIFKLHIHWQHATRLQMRKIFTAA
eukprot:4536884-Pyramimonas_sp.AAC.1